MSNTIELKIDRTMIDSAIEGLGNMFEATEKVLVDYEADKQSLEQRGSHLSEKLAELQEQHAKTLIDREVAKNNPSDYIYMSKELATIAEDMKIYVSLQDQLKEEFKAAKEKHMPIIRDTYGKDVSVKREFDVVGMVDHTRYELIKAIADIASAISQQDRKIMPLIYDEFLDDERLMQDNPSFRRAFDSDRTRLSYSDVSKSVISRNNVSLACGGNIAPEIRKPKEVN